MWGEKERTEELELREMKSLQEQYCNMINQSLINDRWDINVWWYFFAIGLLGNGSGVFVLQIATQIQPEKAVCHHIETCTSQDTAVWSRNEKINLFTRKNHFNTFLPQIWYFLVPYQYQSTLLVHTSQSRILVVVIVGFQWFSVGFYWFSVPFSSFSISFSGFCSEYQCRLYIYELPVVLGPHALYLITNKGLLVVAMGSF